MIEKILMLKFRDLLTEDGETIAEHRSIIKSYKSVWWGAWIRKGIETPPRKFLAQILNTVDECYKAKVYLYDTSRQKIYACEVSDIKVSPIKSGITSPEPEKTPEYYHRNRCPIWFKFISIDDVDFSSLKLYYDSAPTLLSENDSYQASRSNHIESIDKLSQDGSIRSLRDLTKLNVTMWVLQEEK
jgi:hypothetical protein